MCVCAYAKSKHCAVIALSHSMAFVRMPLASGLFALSVIMVVVVGDVCTVRAFCICSNDVSKLNFLCTKNTHFRNSYKPAGR